MPIDLNKPNQSPGLNVLSIEALGAGARGGPSLVALAYGADGSMIDEGCVFHGRPDTFDGGLRLAADSRPLGSAASADVLEVVFARLAKRIRTIMLCLAYDGDGPGTSEVRVRIVESERGEEVHRARIAVSSGLITEVGRLQREGDRWCFLASDHSRLGSISDLLPFPGTRPATRAAFSNKASPLSALAAEPIDEIAAEASAGYCDAAMRRAFVLKASHSGVPSEEAEIIVDIELERLRVANETALLHRLESILRRFTEDDARLDDKERRDALQIVCRPAPGYIHGLRHDVADEYVIRFCRERRVKVKVGLLRWAVP